MLEIWREIVNGSVSRVGLRSDFEDLSLFDEFVVVRLINMIKVLQS